MPDVGEQITYTLAVWDGDPARVDEEGNPLPPGAGEIVAVWTGADEDDVRYTVYDEEAGTTTDVAPSRGDVIGG